MGWIRSFLSIFFYEYDLPSEPIKFMVEAFLLTVFGIPNVIATIISYVYFPPEPKNVNGKVILITGTGRGNGRELALQFHRLGASVVCVDRDSAANGETARRIRDEGGRAVALTADITDRGQVRAMHAAARRLVGPVDVLVNNAGVVEATLFADPDADDAVTRVVDTNLLGQIWVIREILPSMLERNSGHIVSVSSMSSLRGLAFKSTYCATKFAVNGLMESLANELKLMESDIITTTICPYFIANCPEKSKRRLLRFPEIPTEDACEMMIEGILRNDRVFTIPSTYSLYILQLIKLLPEVLQDMFNDFVYAKFQPTAHEEEIVQKYTKLAKMSKTQTAFHVPCMQMGSVPD